ncbi:RING finger domain-containing protein [Endozoicomonas sp. 2B-B]
MDSGQWTVVSWLALPWVMNMPHLRKLVIFILLIFCAASYGYQVDTYEVHISFNHNVSYEDYDKSFSSGLLNLLTAFSLYYDEYVSSDHSASYEDYVQSFYTGLLDLLTYLSLYYDHLRLPLRLSEMVNVALLRFLISKSASNHNYIYIAILSISLLSGFLANTAYDLSVFFNSNESSLLAIFRLIAKIAEHELSIEAFCCLARQLFPGLCLICLDSLKDPAAASCAKHWYCQACIDEWAKQSPFCPLCER